MQGWLPSAARFYFLNIFRVSFKCKLYDGRVRPLSSVRALRILNIISRGIVWKPQNTLDQPQKMECGCPGGKGIESGHLQGYASRIPKNGCAASIKKEEHRHLFSSCVSDRNPLWTHSSVTSKHCFSPNYKPLLFSAPCCCLHPFQVSVCCQF